MHLVKSDNCSNLSTFKWNVMNKMLLCICLLLTSFYLVQGQESRYGIRIGGNYSAIISDNLTGDFEDERIGMVIGFFAEYRLTNKINIQPELQFSNEGNKEDGLKLNYLQLPILFKYNFSQVVNLQLGPQVGLKIWEWEDDGFIEQNFNTFNFAAVGGLGFNINDNFFIDARYAYGLTNVFEDEGVQSGFDGNTSVVQLSVGYRL